MNRFLKRPVLSVFSAQEIAEARSSVQLYSLVEDFVYESDTFGRITVPAGFVTDFASIPRVVWDLLDPEDPVILYGSIIHDYLYTVAGRVPGLAITLSRNQADQLLIETMALNGAHAALRGTVYEAVHLFGSSHWTP